MVFKYDCDGSVPNFYGDERVNDGERLVVLTLRYQYIFGEGVVPDETMDKNFASLKEKGIIDIDNHNIEGQDVVRIKFL